MNHKIGKYIVRAEAQASQHQGFVGTAHLLWDEDGATCEQAIHFHKSFATADEAEMHALQQVQVRVKDGVL